MSTIINATTTNGVVIQPDNSGSLVLQTNSGTTALTIDTSQNITTTNKFASASMPIGSVLQVVSATYSTQTSRSVNTYADTGLTATITPKFSTSKILVVVDQNGCGKETSDTAINIKILRSSTNIGDIGQVVGYTGTGALSFVGTIGGTILDSPATTSAVTYKTQFSSWQNNAVVYVQFQGSVSTITLMEIVG